MCIIIKNLSDKTIMEIYLSSHLDKIITKTYHVTKFLTILATYTYFGLNYPLKEFGLLWAMARSLQVSYGQWSPMPCEWSLTPRWHALISLSHTKQHNLNNLLTYT